MWILAAIGVAATVLLAWSYASSGTEVTLATAGAAISLTASLAAFVLCGALIVSRQPRNGVGWLLMIPGLVVPVSTLATNWLGSLDPAPQQVTPGLWLLVWALAWSWVLLIFPILHLLLIFPDGHLLSARWRWAVALEAVLVGTMMVLSALGSEVGIVVDDQVAWSLPNPIGVLPENLFDSALGTVWEAALLLITVTSAAAVVLRFRRGSPEVRRQLKWPLLAVVLFGVVYGATAVDPDLASEGSILFAFALAGLPISVAIAVLRYRLYAIDHLISRTVSWAVISALLVGAFVATVFGLQAVLVGVTQASTIAVAASTLVAFSLFQPVRRRVQRLVDRRFDRARFDAERTAAAFADRLRGEVAIDAIATDLQATLDDSIKPSAQVLWLRSVPDRPHASIS